MLSYFPKYFINKAIVLYIGSIIVVSLLFISHTMSWYWYIFGLIEVIGFFYFSNLLTKRWINISEKTFLKKLFSTALIIRVIWVIFSYWFYILMTGQPFEFSAGDAIGYHKEAIWVHQLIADGNLESYWAFISGKYSDAGYPFYLGLQYTLTGDSIFIARIIKAILSAFMCILIYRLAARNFGETTGRMAAIFCMLMPNLIYYCGLNLKETEMVFLSVAFVERTDLLLRSKRYTFFNILGPLLLASSLFLFRTVLGATALMAFFSALVFSSAKIVGWGKRALIGTWIVLAVGYFLGGKISSEVEEVWENRTTNQEKSLAWRASEKNKAGNKFAKYAGGAVFAPMIFTIPFPTMINSPWQENQQLMNGSNYVKNITSFFTIAGIIFLIYRRKWRDHILILSFLIGYLGVIAMSAFAQSERFHLPSLPFALIIGAYGLSQMTNKNKKHYKIYLAIIFVAIIGWNWFKLAGKGII